MLKRFSSIFLLTLALLYPVRALALPYWESFWLGELESLLRDQSGRVWLVYKYEYNSVGVPSLVEGGGRNYVVAANFRYVHGDLDTIWLTSTQGITTCVAYKSENNYCSLSGKYRISAN
jgi:hypothetical protein